MSEGDIGNEKERERECVCVCEKVITIFGKAHKYWCIHSRKPTYATKNTTSIYGKARVLRVSSAILLCISGSRRAEGQ
jgi:hypothetical protein